MARLPRSPNLPGKKAKSSRSVFVAQPEPTVSFILEVDVTGAFPSNYKPIQLTALRVPVRFVLPAAEAAEEMDKLIEVTLRGAALLGEQMRVVTRDLALEQSGG
jgi:hypothetical protein